MALAGSKTTTLVAMAGAGVVLCGALAVLTEYANTKIKVKQPPAAKTGPAGPFAKEIAALPHYSGVVTQVGRDEAEYLGRYVRTTAPGLYLDVVSGEVLFTSLDKLETGHGYAEFSKPFDPARLEEKEEPAHDTRVMRLQVRSKLANSYLGWISPEDPPGTRRYVINSAALRFVRLEDLEKNGLGMHRSLFPATPAAPPPAPQPAPDPSPAAPVPGN